jgi:hypothetical protein
VGYFAGQLQSLVRQDIIQVILSNVFRKSDFETIFETILVPFFGKLLGSAGQFLIIFFWNLWDNRAGSGFCNL